MGFLNKRILFLNTNLINLFFLQVLRGLAGAIKFNYAESRIFRNTFYPDNVYGGDNYLRRLNLYFYQAI